MWGILRGFYVYGKVKVELINYFDMLWNKIVVFEL